MRAFCQWTAFKLGLHLLFPGSLAYWSTLKTLTCQPQYDVNQFLKIKLLIINLQLNTYTHKYRSFTQILSNKIVKFYFILCNQFLKSFRSLLWVLYGFLSCLDLRDACRSHLYTQLWPEISRSWLDSFCLLFSTSLVTGEFTYKHAFSPTAWGLGFRIRDRMVSLSEKTSRRPLLPLSPSVWNFHTQQQASREPLCEGEEWQAGSQALQKLQGHESEFSSQYWIEDPLWGPQSQARGWMRACEQASLDDIPVTRMALNSYAQFRRNAGSRVSWVC